MSSKSAYTTPWPKRVHEGAQSGVNMTGVPTIPQAAITFWTYHGFETDLPPSIERLTDDAIAEAMAEHRRRREAVKIGMDLDEYFPDMAARDEDDA